MSSPSARESDISRAVSLLSSVSEILRGTLQNSPETSRSDTNTRDGHSSTDNLSTSMRSVASKSSILAEVRTNFAPYTVPNIRNGRIQTVPSRSSGGSRSLSAGKLWNKVFFCLGGPEDRLSPGNNRSFYLESMGLGLKPISINRYADVETFTTVIVSTFPKLENVKFEILRALGGGSGKELVKMGDKDNLPTPKEISLIQKGPKIAYIRPLVSIDTETSETLRREINEEITDTSANYDNITGSGTSSVENSSDVTAVIESINHIDTRNSEALRREVAIARADDQLSIPNASNDSIVNYIDCVTLTEWRENLYFSNLNEKSYIFLQRLSTDDYAEQVLGVYKGDIDIHKQPHVMFANELGTDLGALTKEYFLMGMESLLVGKLGQRLPYFEGNRDFKLPSCDSSLLRANIFKIIGKFMAHNAIHTGIAFIGLSESVVDFFINEDHSYEAPLLIKTDDLADYSLQETVKNIEKWEKGNVPAQEIYSNICHVAIESNFNEVINEDNLRRLKEHILYHHVFEKRRAQLESLKLGFFDNKLGNFIKGKEYIIRGLFRKWSDFNYPASLVISKITCLDDSQIVQFVKEYIMENLNENENVKKLLAAWTGYPELPESLSITIVEDNQFNVKSCFNEMNIPRKYNKEKVYEMLNLLINNCSGFGRF